MSRPNDSAKRALAEFEVRSAEQARQRLQEQHDAGARWLLASLFAINAGAIIALIGSELIDSDTAVGPLILYFAAVLCSFAMGVAVQISDRRMVAAVHSWGQLWTVFLETDVVDEDANREARRKISSAEKVGRRGRTFGLMSMSLWIVASGWALLNIVFNSR